MGDMIEDSFRALSLYTPESRFIATSAVTAALLYVAKPALFFNPDGSMRQWNMLAPEDPNSTVLPLYLAAVGAGAIVYFTV